MSNADSHQPRSSLLRSFPQGTKRQTGTTSPLKAALNQDTSRESLRLEGDLIEQQHKLLRAYDQTATQWAKAEADAKAQLEREQEAAETELKQAREQADEQLSQVQNMLTEAQGWLQEKDWNQLIKQVSRHPSGSLANENLEPKQKILSSIFWKQHNEIRINVIVNKEGNKKIKDIMSGFEVSIYMIPFVTAFFFFITYPDIIKYVTINYTLYFILLFSLLWFIFLVLIRYLVRNRFKKWVEEPYLSLLQAANDVEYYHRQWMEQAQQIYQRKMTDAQARYQRTQAEIEREFSPKMAKVRPAFAKLTAQGYLLSPAWGTPVWNSWQAAVRIPEITRLGQLEVGKRQDELVLPALLALPGERSLLFRATGAAKSTAVEAIQSLVLRLLASIPPGKLQCTFFDPVGLGQNVASFMHLADHDEKLVTSRAWTEPRHIEQQLADLTEHMTNVIQKYLRNQYATIEAYNRKSDVAQPYRILVVLDFPVNFSEEAARRLVSIAQNGPRCGVYTVVLVDTSQPLPHGFNMADLEQGATVIAWDGERFVWEDEPDFQNCQLILDTPPSLVLSQKGEQQNLFTRIIETVGKAAKSASTVAVPFERIAPPREEFWQGSTIKELKAPLGPAGAGKLQQFHLGKGTAHHVLVAGKTGSGKSTLFHVLITNLALIYSPQEIELYLIDFKEGVEFKSYAGKDGHPPLPHARVIAIETEREFGLSVLQGLNAELKRRGELCRRTGVENLTNYREKSGQKMPRILLLVDEFQEFFTEDDQLASAAGQILERLVRQGRSFGIHVLLSSQTLAGAYTLARSTMGQMTVRIALQCSDADSRLILADDNGAARLLTRPGEAIYNATNGMEEGNNFFQVAWLPDELRGKYLRGIEALARQRRYHPAQPPIIFEGNAAAEIKNNQPLRKLLTSYPTATQGRALRSKVWLGEPIAIRPEPTHALFRRQSGSNLLIVGQHNEAALAMMAMSLCSLMAHVPPSQQIFFFVLDFSAVDGPHANYFKELAPYLPRPIRVMRSRQVPQMINNFHTEVQRRIKRDETSAPPIYLLLYGLQRARDLRQDDSFGGGFGGGFSFDNDPTPAPPNPAQQFPTILRDGPEVGVHTIVWCDTLTNLNRTLDRRAQREFVMRVAFQMSTDDSANLVDTPAASKLGEHRALFYNEEESRIEKFRPYGLPSQDWLTWVGEQLRKG